MLLPAIRKKKVLEFINENGSADIRTLARRFQVANATIRNDLIELHHKSLIVRTHGGAVSIFADKGLNSPHKKKKILRQTAKDLLGKQGARFVFDGDTIALDNSTTVFSMVPHIKRYSDLTVITNSLAIMTELATSDYIQVIGVGGKLDSKTLSFLGSETEETLSKYCIDRAFISPKGLSLDNGLTDERLETARLHKIFIENASETIVLADLSKFDKARFAPAASLATINTLITDQKPPQEYHTFLERNNIRLVVP